MLVKDTTGFFLVGFLLLLVVSWGFSVWVLVLCFWFFFFVDATKTYYVEILRIKWSRLVCCIRLKTNCLN